MKTYQVTVTPDCTVWRFDGELHCEDGPACEYYDGAKYWYFKGLMHREDGPAVESANGSKSWWINGERHRENGPAVEYADGTKFLFINDVELTEEQFNARVEEIVKK